MSRTIQVLQFSELDEKAKARAIEEARQYCMDYDWHDYVVEQWKEKLEKKGYRDIEIMFSGFGSQGDGASFTATVDLPAWLKAKRLGKKYTELRTADDVDARIKRNDSRYVHQYTVDAEIETYAYLTDGVGHDEVERQAGEVEELLTEDVRALSGQIYRDLEEEYFDVSSDESIAHQLEINEWEFLPDGRRV